MTILDDESSLDTNKATDLICIASIPNSIEIKDLLKMLEGYKQNLSHIQFVKNDNVYLYMAILKFSDKAHAMKFYRENSKTFLNELLQMASNIYMIKSIKSNTMTNQPLSICLLQGDSKCSICFESLVIFFLETFFE